MKIDKLPSGSYRVRKMIDGKSHSFTWDHKPTQKEILQAIQELPSKQDEILLKGTFADYGRKYIDIKENVTSPSTIRGYETILKNLSPEFLAIKIKDMTAADVQAEINRISVGRSPKTVKNYHGFISPVLGMFRPDLNLVTTLPLESNKSEDYVVPEDEDIKKILTAAKGKSYELALYLGIYAMRRSEVCAVTADDLEGNLLHINKSLVQDKNNKFVLKKYNKTSDSTRTIWIDDYTAQLLKEQGKGFNGYPNNIWDNLSALQTRLGIQHFSYHALRHYYASFAHSLGIPDKYIMANGGWKTDHVMKRIYMKAQENKKQEMMQFAAEYLQEQIINK